MRLKRQHMEIRSGKVLLCDPLVVGDDGLQPIDDGARFQLWKGNGEFHVYTDGASYFIDVDPRVLKAQTRSQLTQISGRVGIDTAQIGIYDLTPSRSAAADD